MQDYLAENGMTPNANDTAAGAGTELSYKERLIKRDYRMAQYLNTMEPELQGRFIALKVIGDAIQKAQDNQDQLIRKSELSYEEKFQEIYKQRVAIVQGLSLPDPALIAAFDERAKLMEDEDYSKVEITPVDTKAIQSGKGISDFWIKAMTNHSIGATISEKDRPILGYLTDIKLDLHPQFVGDGYTLTFVFAPNSYFQGTELKKEFKISNDGDLQSTQGTEIFWQPGCNPTVASKKKKKKGKKVTTQVKCHSFFNFFKDQPKDVAEDYGEGSDGEFDPIMEDQLETADEIKDELIPLALEYYLGAIENDIIDDEDDDDSDISGGGGSDSDSDKKPKKAKKGKKDQPTAGADGKQECKQQ